MLPVSDRMTGDPRVAEWVRSRQIRVALFLPQYAKNTATGEVRGIGMGFVAIEIARVLAARLRIEPTLIELPTPPSAVECIKAGTCDMAFLGIEPSRAAEIDFSPPIVQFGYTIMVPPHSPIRSVTEVDRAGIRIAVVRNHASTSALARMATHAALIASDLPDQAFEMLRDGQADAFAAPREQLLDYCSALPGASVLPDDYGTNNVGIALAKGSAGPLAYISEFVEQAKASGLVGRIIARGGLHGFNVAP
jgi:polar amino acid transport system substrate-binding protein